MGCCHVTLLVFTWCLSSESSVLNNVHPPSVLLLLNSGERSTSVSQSQELLYQPSLCVGLCLLQRAGVDVWDLICSSFSLAVSLEDMWQGCCHLQIQYWLGFTSWHINLKIISICGYVCGAKEHYFCCTECVLWQRGRTSSSEKGMCKSCRNCSSSSLSAHLLICGLFNWCISWLWDRSPTPQQLQHLSWRVFSQYTWFYLCLVLAKMFLGLWPWLKVSLGLCLAMALLGRALAMNVWKELCLVKREVPYNG